MSIEKKVEVIKAKDHTRVGVRALAESFGIGKTQVSEILKNKETILAAYESNASASKKPRLSKINIQMSTKNCTSGVLWHVPKTFTLTAHN